MYHRPREKIYVPYVEERIMYTQKSRKDEKRETERDGVMRVRGKRIVAFPFTFAVCSLETLYGREKERKTNITVGVSERETLWGRSINLILIYNLQPRPRLVLKLM